MGAVCHFIGDLTRPRKQLARGTTSPTKPERVFRYGFFRRPFPSGLFLNQRNNRASWPRNPSRSAFDEIGLN
jgi:hypothetical protein